MTRFYVREYPDYGAGVKRNVLLAVALLCDVITLVFFVRACAGAYLSFVVVGCSLAVSTALRLISLRLGKTWVYNFSDGRLDVSLKYPHKTVVVLSLRSGDFSLCGGDVANCRKLYPDRCDCPAYVIKLSDGERCALALNDYMLALTDVLASKE